MSQLREIMKRLGARATGAAASPSQASVPQADHVEAYGRQLQECSPAMLHYEWAWWDQHLETLVLCLTQPQMLATLGGEARVRLLLEEGEQCRDRLRQRLEELGLPPGQLHGPVVAGEHAWDLSQADIRHHWGIGSPL
ncbi:MAG: hypothetical protein ACKO25_00355 [Cyanobium sp.]